MSCTVAGPTPLPPRTRPSWPTLEPSAPQPTWANDTGATDASYSTPNGLTPTRLHVVVPGYNTRVVAIRTSLGRAAIKLEMRTPARQTIRSSACGDPSPVQTGCSVCELAGETDDMDSAVLDAVLTAFDRYPAKVLEDTHVDKVALCKKLSYEDIPDRGTVGTVDLKEHRLIVSVAPFIGHQYDAYGQQTAEDIVHHELFHLFEFERMHDNYQDDPAWRLWNPLGFTYVDSGGKAPDDDDRPDGFVNAYAATNEIEDKASVYQYLMARPSELCEIEKKDPTLRKKVDILWKRIGAITDDAFLRTRARCAGLD
ncbi:MAG TPA: hypothetical protein VL326_15065 [Kofleriaceae bacterium]|nr:hypothetical protein [Kofleriaceae bacterium]